MPNDKVLRGINGTAMKLMHKKRLIEENTKLKNTIKNLEDQIERLKTKVNDLIATNAFGRHGMPWR